jgi:hypothetical protein
VKDAITSPADLASRLEALKPLSGPKPDAACKSTQVSVQTKAVELFDGFAKDGSGQSLKGFAQRKIRRSARIWCGRGASTSRTDGWCRVSRAS